mmetsp:Transcript_54246/g.89803  ORF Transcript_54246/g.89803 Transcript_54246/m.89803 type:complete len:81 (-) Transcript_54246:148-390(-)
MQKDKSTNKSLHLFNNYNKTKNKKTINISIDVGYSNAPYPESIVSAKYNSIKCFNFRSILSSLICAQHFQTVSDSLLCST